GSAGSQGGGERGLLTGTAAAAPAPAAGSRAPGAAGAPAQPFPAAPARHQEAAYSGTAGSAAPGLPRGIPGSHGHASRAWAPGEDDARLLRLCRLAGASGCLQPALSAQVLLAALWLAASGERSWALQDGTVPGRPRGPASPSPQPPRPGRRAARASCPAGMRWSEAGRRCCAECPAGTFLRSPCMSHSNDSVCEPCPAGTFHSQPNTAPECQACYECDHQAFQSVLRNCSATSNVVCSCEPGRFRHCIDERCSEFTCHECRPCTGRLIQRPCSATQDTQCGSCKPDFYAEGGECWPCHLRPVEKCGEECKRACKDRQGLGLEYLLLGLAGPLFLGALAIYHKRQRLRLRQDASAPGPLPGPAPGPAPGDAVGGCCGGHSSLPAPAPAPAGEAAPWSQVPPAAAARSHPESQALLRCCPLDRDAHAAPCQPSAPPAPAGIPSPGSPPHGPAAGPPLQGSRLYAVIDAVPLRRWKEFVRVLGLPDTEIEVVEVEFTHVRDQQYEMLKRWCQQTSASLDPVFAALKRMELAGCAEALRLRLQDCP
ncbi:tumor necrosis factor receptor superfamily member 25, partial [Apteryx mantelli]|uniref:Tumor necrosis factor receptor superfamily member 25 n=1 Tax=Apteryx mantelli TaxID=2696672 RepID=A0ABM4FQZ4_9AVES